MDFIGSYAWSFVVFVGPIALAIALAYGIVRWRKRRRELAAQGRAPQPDGI